MNEYEWQVQGLYDDENGWEHLTSFEDSAQGKRDALADARLYDEAEPFPHRIRRVKSE